MENIMTLRINDIAPDFRAQTTHGEIRFHDWIGDGWAVLFSHPKDFTPVCTTELGYLAGLEPEFAKRNARIIGLSVDSVETHQSWKGDIRDTQGHAVEYPLIADTDLEVSRLYHMLPADENGNAEERTAVDNATVRTVFVIGPDKCIKMMLSYPMSTGRNFDEILRVLDSLQLTANHSVATPANWQHGEDVIIAASVSDEEARNKYPEGWRSETAYLRFVEQPEA
jgi:alkyl hydroperoxide reductase subunit AhpC